MAVDLMITPLSKYWSGDYVTPVMEDAWAIGASYKVMSPNGDIKTILEGQPYGGELAKSEREGLVEFVEEIMNAIPIDCSAESWNERSDYFGFHRVDPTTFGSLRSQAKSQFTERVGLFDRLKGRKGAKSHLNSALIFIPIKFEQPFDLEGKVFASLDRARNELVSGSWSDIQEDELAYIISAFQEAEEVGLPLVFDV